MEMAARIGITYNLKKDHPKVVGSSRAAEDHAAECEEQDTVDSIARALARNGASVELFPHQSDLLDRLRSSKPDIVFNIAEGWSGRNRESLIPALLELLDIPFTGSDALTLGMALDKAVAKRMVSTVGVPTPRFFKAWRPEDADRVDLEFPVFVKPNCEGSSKGIRNSSKVDSLEALRAKIEWIVSTYHGPALIEAFLPGREFTVGLLGNGSLHVLPIMEVCAKGQDAADQSFVYSYETKIGNLEQMRVPAPISDELRTELSDLAVAVFNVMECRDVARIDFRLDSSGRPHFLEINPLPGLSKASLLPIQAQAMDMGFDSLVNTILESALKRCY